MAAGPAHFVQMLSTADIQRLLASRVRELRLLAGWKQSTLAQRSGVTLASLRRFEQSGLIALESLLKLAHALGRLDDFQSLLQPPPARTIAELTERSQIRLRKRGSR